MAELDQRLLAAAAELEWPPTPQLVVPAEAGARRLRPVLLVAVAAVVAVGVAFAVPGARSAILRALHLEAVTIERVDVLPPAQERPLGAGLGEPIDPAAAAIVLGRPFTLPPGAGGATLRHRDGVVSAVFLASGPVLLSELENGVGPNLIKKLVGGSTSIEAVEVDGTAGYWLSGGAHLYLVPGAPARLAGNVLLWTANGLLYRLEGRGLTKERALDLARGIEGT